MKKTIKIILLIILFPSFAYSGEIYGNIKLKNKFIGKGTHIEIKYGTSTSFCKEEFEALDKQKQEMEHSQGTSTPSCKDKTPTLKRFCETIMKDNLNLDAPIDDINGLNKLLEVPNFYDVLCSKKPDRCFSKDVTELAGKTDYYRDIKFKDLSKDEKSTIKKLNRLLLKETYPQETPKVPEFCDCVIAL